MKKLVILLVLVGGCGTTIPKKVTPTYHTPPRCRLIKTMGTKNVVVIVRRNCLVNGLTTAMIVVTNTKAGKRAAEEGTQILIHSLGFVPVMSLVVMGKVPLKGRPEGVMYLFAITDAKEYLPVVGQK